MPNSSEIKGQAHHSILNAEFVEEGGNSFLIIPGSNNKYKPGKVLKADKRLRIFNATGKRPILVKKILPGRSLLNEEEVKLWNVNYPDNPAKFCKDVILMPLITGEDLMHFREKYQADPSKLVKMLLSIAKALQLFHQKLVHNDFHWGNFLIEENNNSFKINIIDFGRAQRVNSRANFDKDLHLFYKWVVSPILEKLPKDIPLKIFHPSFKKGSLEQIIAWLEADLALLENQKKIHPEAAPAFVIKAKEEHKAPAQVQRSVPEEKVILRNEATDKLKALFSDFFIKSKEMIKYSISRNLLIDQDMHHDFSNDFPEKLLDWLAEYHSDFDEQDFSASIRSFATAEVDTNLQPTGSENWVAKLEQANLMVDVLPMSDLRVVPSEVVPDLSHMRSENWTAELKQLSPMVDVLPRSEAFRLFRQPPNLPETPSNPFNSEVHNLLCYLALSQPFKSRRALSNSFFDQKMGSQVMGGMSEMVLRFLLNDASSPIGLRGNPDDNMKYFSGLSQG